VRGARRALERQLYARAARLITVTDALRDDFRSFLPLPAAHVVTISNGYDADLIHATPLPPRAAGEPRTILYAGSASFGAGRDLAGFLRGVDLFAARASCPVRVRLMGLFAAHELPALQHAALEQSGWRPREEVARSLQDADVLAVLTGNHASVATTKLFEYIGAGRPILVVGRASAAARIVLDSDCGVVADDDPESIARALAELEAQRERWREQLSTDAAARVRRGFSRQGQAAALARQIRDVLADARR
jgi:glycosyltransferase involved in cell wall biosynthesis